MDGTLAGSAPRGPGDLTLTPRETLSMGLIYAVLAVVTVGSFVAAFRFLPHQYSGKVVPGGVIFTGLAITAHLPGLRHGFDADRIAAIDNTTRPYLALGIEDVRSAIGVLDEVFPSVGVA